jgi:adenylate cyclase, class 2
MDMLEIEIKSRCEDHAVVIGRLRSMGALHKETRHERDLYLNHPARDFRSTDEALRLRQVGETAVLTYKGPRLGGESKTRREEEVAVSGYETMLGILTLLGFTRSWTITKERDVFMMGDIEICIDRVDDLGDFVELEKKGVDRGPIEKELFRLAAELGLDRFEKKSYLELKYGDIHKK